MIKDLEHYIAAASKGGRPPRPGIILGIRMCLHALKVLEFEPVEHKRLLVVIVEIDRCFPDAVQLVTGCRVGNRTLKLRDMGKMAATFVDLRNGRAVRLSARDAQRVANLFPAMDKDEALSVAYRTRADEELFETQSVRVNLAPEDVPGYKTPRVICAECGEEIRFHREVRIGDRTLCHACASDRYYEPL